MRYKLASLQSVIRLQDSACIPFDEKNKDYQDYIAWLALGNQPDPIDPPTPEEIAAEAYNTALIVTKAEAKDDTIVQYLRDHSPAECAQYVQNNVTDLASAKAFLKKVAVVLCALSKESLR